MDASSWKFAQALQGFDTGIAGADSLVNALDADLAAGVAALSLIELLDRHNIDKPLPEDIYGTLAGRLRPGGEGGGLAAEDVTIDLDAPARRKSGEPIWGVDHTGPPLADRYQLLELIGRGGTSEVYKAIDLRQAAHGDINYYVAIKVLAAHTLSGDGRAALERHLAELKGLVHVNIAQLIDWGLHGEVFYIALEYTAGRSLDRRLRRGPIPRAQALLILNEVAEALEAAHQRSVIHGDLTPGNILVSEIGEVKLIDFAWEGTPRRALVTPRYSSPQRMQRLAPAPSDDVFALACIAFELLTGQPAISTAAIRRDSLELPPTDQLSETQRAALKHALDPDRAARTPSARAFMQELLEPVAPPLRTSWLKWLPAALVAGMVLGYFVRQYLIAPRLLPAPTVVRPSEPEPAPASSPPGTTLRDCPTCAALRVLPAGTLVRGAHAEDKTASSFETPQQSVTIAYPFAMAANAVTVGEYQEFVNATGRESQACEIYDGRWHVDAAASWQNPGFTQTPLHPVTCVSFTDATDYAAWVSQKSGHHYRLPSAAEWEYAARAGTEAVVPWANPADACRSANVADQSAARRYPGFTVFACDDGYVNTAPVGSYAANAFGLFDMIGNVFAWTEDCWSPSYAGAPQDGSARVAADCAERELRGGSWFSSPAFLRTSYRNHFAADYRGSSVGIRLVRDLT